MLILISEEEEKGVDCISQFRTMQECFKKYPEEYSKFNDDEEGGGEGKPSQTDDKPPAPQSATKAAETESGSEQEQVGEFLELNRS